jgi:hypothetical protein
MNNNRSGTSELHMSVRKFRAKIHEAYKAGVLAARANPTGFEMDEDAVRREYVNEVVKELNWR